MPHGQPDYGAQAPKTTIYGLSDLGEVVARLGGIVTYDRRGDVIFLDDFESGIANWYTYGSGTGYDVAQSSVLPKAGSFSLKLTGGSDTSLYAAAQRVISPPPLSKFGLEVAWCPWTAYDVIYVTIDLGDADGTHKGVIRHDYTAKTLAYYDSAGNYQSFATGIQVAVGLKQFHMIKLVIDPATDKYVRCLYDGNEYDLSSYDLYTAAAAEVPNILMDFWLTSRSGENDVAYIDNVIATQNEP
jgi:hypothetical protein